MSFHIQRGKNTNFPLFNRPEIVGYFSLNGQDRKYSQDFKQLKYYYDRHSRRVHFDLNKGIDRVIKKKNDANEKLEHLLFWIVNNYRSILAPIGTKRWIKPEFVCYRGLLTKICCTPFEIRDGWIICAAKLHGTIYLCAFENDEQKYRNANLTSRDLKFMSWGFKFEQYLLTNTPDGSPDTTEPVNEAEEFCCMFSTKLQDNVLLYGAEMDGVCTKDVIKEPIDWKTIKFVELKTNRGVENDRQDQNFRKKLLKWWCQSFLVGIETVVCGNRTDLGLVYDLDTMKVSDMPKMAKAFWNASECMNFCSEFLKHIKTVVTRQYNECIYKFEYKLDNEIKMQELPISSEFSFLPDWYIEQVNQIIKAR